MKRLLLSCSALVLSVAAIANAAGGEQKTVTGWVIDSACAFTKGLSKPISVDCATSCAKAGSPLVILDDNGSIYWPISESMPASGQNPRLLPFAAKRVTISGKVYVRNGSNAIAIEKIANAAGH